MDKDRQIRFLYPPLFFVGFWLWALYLDPTRSLSSYFGEDNAPISVTGNLLGILAGGGAVILVLGFLIGSLSVGVLRVGFRFAGHHTYEAVLSDECRKRLTKAVGLDGTVSKRKALYLAATFDHALLPDNIQTWLLRRWSAFNISAHSSLGLVLASIAVWWSGVKPGYAWYLVSFGSLASLMAHAAFAWSDTMKMREFYSHLGPSMLRDSGKEGHGAQADE